MSYTPNRRTAQGRFRPWLQCLTTLLVFASGPAFAQTPVVVTGHDAYVIGEDITAEFSGGPGNPKDWVGIYPLDVTPGSVGSTIWNYVDGTKAGTTGLTEGTITYPAGLNFAGPWKAYFLLNDGYTILAETAFQVVEPGTPLVRVNKRTYTTGEAIITTFSSGPGNPKDWVGIYQEGQTPGNVDSTIWNYTDGTQNGIGAVTDGSITFTTGLTAPGRYVAYFLLNDGYTALATESFTVIAPAGSKPRILSQRPADGATGVSPKIIFDAAITNGSTAVNASTIVLKLDGQTVPAVIAGADGLTTVRYTNSSLSLALTAHIYELTFSDNGTPATEVRSTGSFTIAQYENIVLPAPIVLETFDGTAEGQIPAGWTTKSYTEVLNTEPDLGNLDSASFANWLVLDVDRFRGSFVTYSNPDNPDDWETDYRRVLTPNPLNVLNGELLEGPLASGRMLFGDSGYRNGRSQVLYVSTPDFDLTGKTDVFVAFKSLYEQNQDSMGALEYSVDGGTSWLPIAYLIDAADIVRTEAGDLDAEATLNTTAGDIAVYTDENGAEVGGYYGAFIGAPISTALAPYIQGRVNDNTSESKRVEKYRLPQADNARTVRFRFAYAGTDSWYWGVDDFGLYSIPAVPPAAPVLSAEVTPTGLRLSWPADTTGFVLEGSPSLTPPAWTPVDGVTGNSVTLPFTGDGKLFRLHQP